MMPHKYRDFFQIFILSIFILYRCIEKPDVCGREGAIRSKSLPFSEDSKNFPLNFFIFNLSECSDYVLPL